MDFHILIGIPQLNKVQCCKARVFSAEAQLS